MVEGLRYKDTMTAIGGTRVREREILSLPSTIENQIEKKEFTYFPFRDTNYNEAMFELTDGRYPSMNAYAHVISGSADELFRSKIRLYEWDLEGRQEEFLERTITASFCVSTPYSPYHLRADNVWKPMFIFGDRSRGLQDLVQKRYGGVDPLTHLIDLRTAEKNCEELRACTTPDELEEVAQRLARPGVVELPKDHEVMKGMEKWFNKYARGDDFFLPSKEIINQRLLDEFHGATFYHDANEMTYKTVQEIQMSWKAYDGQFDRILSCFGDQLLERELYITRGLQLTNTWGDSPGDGLRVDFSGMRWKDAEMMVDLAGIFDGKRKVLFFEENKNESSNEVKA